MGEFVTISVNNLMVFFVLSHFKRRGQGWHVPLGHAGGALRTARWRGPSPPGANALLSEEPEWGPLGGEGRWVRSEQICPRGPNKDDISGADEGCPAETRLNKGSAGSVGQRDCLTLRNRAQTRLEMFFWPPAPQGRQPQPAAQAKLRRWSQAGAERRPPCAPPRLPPPPPTSFSALHICMPPGAQLRLQHPSCDQKDITEWGRQKFEQAKKVWHRTRHCDFQHRSSPRDRQVARGRRPSWSQLGPQGPGRRLKTMEYL